MKKLLLVLAALIFISGCQRFNFISVNKVNDEQQDELIRLYIDELPTGIDSKYRQIAYDAVDYWNNKYVDRSFFKMVESRREADTLILFRKEFEDSGYYHKLGHTGGNSYVEISLGDGYCNGYKQYSYNSLVKVSEHELGHVLGLGDDYYNKDNVMYFQENDTIYEYDVNENFTLDEGWTRWHPVCTRWNLSRYSLEINSNQPLDVYVFDSYGDAKTAINNRFKSDGKCIELLTTDYRQECYVKKDGGLLVSFSGKEAAKFKAEYKLIAREIG